jgi:hypothetical protein
MVLAQKQAGRPMDQNRRSRLIFNEEETNWYSTKEPKTHNGEKTASSINAGGKTGYPHIEDWNQIPVFQPVSKSTQSGSKTLI